MKMGAKEAAKSMIQINWHLSQFGVLSTQSACIGIVRLYLVDRETYSDIMPVGMIVILYLLSYKYYLTDNTLHILYQNYISIDYYLMNIILQILSYIYYLKDIILHILSYKYHITDISLNISLSRYFPTNTILHILSYRYYLPVAIQRDTGASGRSNIKVLFRLLAGGIITLRVGIMQQQIQGVHQYVNRFFSCIFNYVHTVHVSVQIKKNNAQKVEN